MHAEIVQGKVCPQDLVYRYTTTAGKIEYRRLNRTWYCMVVAWCLAAPEDGSRLALWVLRSESQGLPDAWGKGAAPDCLGGLHRRTRAGIMPRGLPRCAETAGASSKFEELQDSVVADVQQTKHVQHGHGHFSRPKLTLHSQHFTANTAAQQKMSNELQPEVSLDGPLQYLAQHCFRKTPSVAPPSPRSGIHEETVWI